MVGIRSTLFCLATDGFFSGSMYSVEILLDAYSYSFIFSW